jgi:tRNA 2-selenouridine synthase
MALQVIRKIDIKSFLELSLQIPVVDVRSPSEFEAGHIPGAFNIPLFNDKEREVVGITYKKGGRTKAILKGLDIAGPAITAKLKEALKISVAKKLLVYCWRGGMRSETMAWLFSIGDIDTIVLQGGYKSYRNYILESFSEKKKLIVLGGLTGSGKTYILKYLKKSGHQVVDMEGLANHKGSAFGALGQSPQPTSEHFANLLYDEWRQINIGKSVWLEDESRNIGTVFMPDNFYSNIQKSPLIVLMMDAKTRIPRLMDEYSVYSPEDLGASVIKISKRLGGDKTKETLKAIETGDFARAIEITLQYYDKAYLYGLKSKPAENIHYVHTDTDDIKINAFKVLEAADKLTWE